MYTFDRAIVKEVPETLDRGLTSADLGSPDYGRARQQHSRYVEVLTECGVEVTVLDAEHELPDSVFVEDTAVVTEEFVMLTNPGAETRRPEVQSIAGTLQEWYGEVERIQPPGTLEGGDVLHVGDHFYIGLTRRTNREGARQLADALGRHGYGATVVALREFLHLKTGIAYLGDGNLVVAGELADHGDFEHFNRIVVPPEEEYCANCIRVNDHVMVPAGYDVTPEKISAQGYEIEEIDMSEFQKVDGGLSCLSLRMRRHPETSAE